MAVLSGVVESVFEQYFETERFPGWTRAESNSFESISGVGGLYSSDESAQSFTSWAKNGSVLLVGVVGLDLFKSCLELARESDDLVGEAGL
jgi:hypothetical protein